MRYLKPTRPRHRTRQFILLPALGLLMALLAAACSSDDFAAQASLVSEDAYEYEASNGDDAYADEEMSEEMSLSAGDRADVATSATTTGSAGAQEVNEVNDLGRDIIFTADLHLGSTDVDSATREAISAVEALGGFLFSQDITGGANASSVMVFKISPDQFQRALAALGSVGSVKAQSVSAEDVTSVVVDLQSRITTAEASVARLRGFLDEAGDINVIAQLENQLLERETALEQLRGRLRTTQNRVDLATITVRVSALLNQPSLFVETGAYLGHDGGFQCLDGGRVSSVTPDEPVTVCYRIQNTGDTPLTALNLSDPNNTTTVSDLVLVEGSLGTIEPGAMVVLAHEIDASESFRMRTTVTATALDIEGNPLADEVSATAATFRILVEDDGARPGFGDTVSKSWKLLGSIFVWLAIVAVAALPFIVTAAIVASVGLFVWRRRGRLMRQTSDGSVPLPPTSADERTPVSAGAGTGEEA